MDVRWGEVGSQPGRLPAWKKGSKRKETLIIFKVISFFRSTENFPNIRLSLRFIEKKTLHLNTYYIFQVDKNFEKYSDAVRAQAPERIDAIIGERTVQRRSSEDAAKKSSLQMNVVKTEDPLVAFKVSFFLPIYFSSSRLWSV